MKGKLSLLVLILALVNMTLAYGTKSSEMSMLKRDIKPNWEDLGWAWGKRNVPDMTFPRRFLRSMKLVKKNPDWHDLGWTWGRRK